MGFPFDPVGAGLVYNVKSYGAFGDGVHDDTAAWQAAGLAASSSGGVVYATPGTYLISSSIPLYTGVVYMGAGMGATVLKASGNITGMFSAVLSSGGTLTNCGVSDMTVNGNTGPTGTTTGVQLDSSANANILTRGIFFERVHFVNCAAGINHAGNNASAGPMNNKVVTDNCVFDTCAAGYQLKGTYGVEILNCHGLQNTLATVVETSIRSGGPTNNGQGPTTVTRISGLHVEGRGDLTGSLGYSDDGIDMAGSDTRITGCELSNVSQYPIHFESAENEGSLIDDIVIWGCGGPMLYCDGSPYGQDAVITNVVGAFICQNTNLNPSYGKRAALALNGGSWMVDNVMVADAASHTPPYALSVGADSPNQMGVVKVSRFYCLAVGTSWLQVLGPSQSNMVLSIKDSPGLNPAGATAPWTAFSLPVSGTAWTNNTGVDGTLYCTAAGTVTDVVAQGVTVASSLAVGQSFFVPAGGTITFTYSSAPTLVFVGD